MAQEQVPLGIRAFLRNVQGCFEGIRGDFCFELGEHVYLALHFLLSLLFASIDALGFGVVVLVLGEDVVGVFIRDRDRDRASGLGEGLELLGQQLHSLGRLVFLFWFSQIGAFGFGLEWKGTRLAADLVVLIRSVLSIVDHIDAEETLEGVRESVNPESVQVFRDIDMLNSLFPAVDAFQVDVPEETVSGLLSSEGEHDLGHDSKVICEAFRESVERDLGS